MHSIKVMSKAYLKFFLNKETGRNATLIHPFSVMFLTHFSTVEASLLIVKLQKGCLYYLNLDG